MKYKKNDKTVPIRKTGIRYFGIQNPRREIQNPRLSWIPSHGEKQRDRRPSTFSLAVLLHQQGSATSWATFPCSFFGPDLHDLFSTSWTIMAHQTLAIRPSRNCANYKKLRCCKGTLATEFHFWVSCFSSILNMWPYPLHWGRDVNCVLSSVYFVLLQVVPILKWKE